VRASNHLFNDIQLNMEAFFDFLTHAAIILGLVIKFIVILKAIESADVRLEKMIRLSSLTSALMIYFGADAMGISVSDLILKAVIPFKPFTFGLVAIVIPSASGILLTWYCIKSLEHSTSPTDIDGHIYNHSIRGCIY